MDKNKETNISTNSPLGGRGAVLLWIRICRPQTLFASLVPVLVAALSVGPAYQAAAPLLCTASCALSLQILSNLINDYYDYVRGTDKAGRAGFKRALAEGEVTKKAMLIACLTAAAVACLLGLYLVYIGGWVILAIGISALLFAWLYTATSHSLSYLGIADIFVFLYYGVVASCGTAYILYSYTAMTATCDAADSIMTYNVADSIITYNAADSIMSHFVEGGTDSPMMRSFFAGGVSGFISMCVLLINNLRDIDDDRRVGKKTLPVRFGKHTGEALMLIVILLMPLFALLAWGWSPSMLIVIPALALWIKVLKAKGAEYNKCLLMAGLLNLAYFLLVLF